jgi:hypothetical protein
VEQYFTLIFTASSRGRLTKRKYSALWLRPCF